MKVKPSTILYLIVVIVLNMVVTSYMTNEIISRSTPQSNLSSEIDALGERLDKLAHRIDILTGFVESKHGYISDLHPTSDDPGDAMFEDGWVRIGVIAPTSQSYSSYLPYFMEIIEPAMNELAWNMGSDLNFLVDVYEAQGQAAVHLELIQGLRNEGVNIVIGGMWSSQACASLSYCNYNDMLLFSPSSTSPLLGIEGDNLFRLGMTDFKQSSVLTEMLDSKGIEAVIVMQRGDAWADGICNDLEPLLEDADITIYHKVRYAAEVVEFSEYLDDVEDWASKAVDEYGWGKVGVQLISFSEAVNILKESKEYPTLYNLTWFGSDGTAQTQRLVDDAPEEASHLKLYSPTPVVPDTDEFDAVAAQYLNITGTELDFYKACSYDIAMILTRSIIDSGSLDVDVLKNAIPDVCEGYTGITGLCTLDISGDRAYANYGIYSYGYRDGEMGCWQVGLYSDTGELTWFDY